MQPAAVNLRDRTAEYFSTFEVLHSKMLAAEQEAADSAQALRKAAGPNGAHHRKGASLSAMAGVGTGDKSPLLDRSGALHGNASSVPAQSAFTTAASQISKSIALVAEKLEKLSALARQRTNFDDPVNDINKLTFGVKRDLKTVEEDIDRLQAFAQQTRDGGRQSAASSQAIVDSLKKNLAGNVRSFSDVLQLRTKNLKEQTARKKNFEGDTKVGHTRKRTADPFQAILNAKPVVPEADADAPDAVAGGFKRKTNGNSHGAAGAGAGAGEAKAELKLNASGSLAFDAELDTANARRQRLDPNGVAQEQEQQQVQARRNEQSQGQSQDAYLMSRVEDVQNIEKSLVELGAQFRRLVEIVGQQDEVILRIDEDVSNALDHVQGGQSELGKYYENLSNSQWLIAKIFAVLIAFAVFFIVFVA